jgi:hypothetical protein
VDDDDDDFSLFRPLASPSPAASSSPAASASSAPFSGGALTSPAAAGLFVPATQLEPPAAEGEQKQSDAALVADLFEDSPPPSPPPPTRAEKRKRAEEAAIAAEVEADPTFEGSVPKKARTATLGSTVRRSLRSSKATPSSK